MHLETTYRRYKTKKTAQDRKPVDLMFEYKNTFIPYAGRVKVPGYKNIVVWETALRNPNEKWDGYTSLPYRAAVSSGRHHYTGGTTTGKVNSSNTADDSQMVIWLGSAVMAAAAVVVLTRKQKRVSK